MFQLTNDTPFAVERSVQLDADGVQHWVVVVKATYKIDGRATRLADEQEPVSVGPSYLGEPGQSSLLRESEMTYDHPGTDVLINAVAHAPAGRAVRQMDVRITVGPLNKSIRVLGDRKWVAAGMDLVASPAVSFETMPICYERAFGGALEDGTAFEERNPIGRGFGLKREHLRDKLLPNIEDPTRPIQRFQDRPPPAGLGAVAGHWLPRRPLAGTYDEKWRREKLPLYPDDFRPAFFVAASSGLHAPEPLRGGERARLEGVSRDGPLELTIPREVITVQTQLGATKLRREAQLDRVIIEPEAQRLVLVWRASERVGLKFRDVKQSYVFYKPRISR